MKRVIIESPYAGRANGWIWPLSIIVRWLDRRRNVKYLRACLHDSLMRGEAPFASHAIYPQPGVLRDHIQAERTRGLAAGFVWGDIGALRVIYVDRGMPSGMKLGIDRAKLIGQRIEERSIPGWRKRAKLPALPTL